MNISDKGLDLIKQFEGCRLKAYRDSVGVPTIGYGHTSGVKMGQTITQGQATAYLRQDCVRAEAAANKYARAYGFNQNQFDALVSFAFNLGGIDKLTANGTRNMATIAGKIVQYNKAGGKVLAGLTARRKAELALFNTPVAVAGNPVIKAGQVHANNFAQCGLNPDGIRGDKTREASVKVVQRALNVDYGANIKEDGAWGKKTDAAFGKHYVKVGETQYLVTALEILCNLKGIEADVECPGKFGGGLETACGTSKAYKDVFKALCQ